MEKISGNLPRMFVAPRDTGSRVDLRIRAHVGGNGEAVARLVDLRDARLIARAVNFHDAMADRLLAACQLLERLAGNATLTHDAALDDVLAEATAIRGVLADLEP